MLHMVYKHFEAETQKTSRLMPCLPPSNSMCVGAMKQAVVLLIRSFASASVPVTSAAQHNEIDCTPFYDCYAFVLLNLHRGVTLKTSQKPEGHRSQAAIWTCCAILWQNLDVNVRRFACLCFA